jgi:hypothetical protein
MRFTPRLFVVASLAATGLVACHKSEEPSAVVAPAAQNAIKGTVMEVLPAAPYTYLRLKAGQGEIWAAVPAGDVKVGAEVTLLVQVKMDKFESKTLARTFDAVYMGTLAGDAPTAAAAAPAPAPDPAALAASVAATHAAPPFPNIEKVAKATGPDAHTIAEIYAGKSALKDRALSVKAKVMKVRSGIMGKTWIHLSDGSGQAQSHDYDLTVTTKDAVQGGDVVTVKGFLHLNRDFGAGYVYPVIIEDAKIVR